jgi:leucyl-tRNA synthetase
LCIEDEVTVVVQVNGKVRSRVSVARDASEDTVRTAAMEQETVRTALAGGEARAIFVPNRLLNLVTR